MSGRGEHRRALVLDVDGTTHRWRRKFAEEYTPDGLRRGVVPIPNAIRLARAAHAAGWTLIALTGRGIAAAAATSDLVDALERVTIDHVLRAGLPVDRVIVQGVFDGMAGTEEWKTREIRALLDLDEFDVLVHVGDTLEDANASARNGVRHIPSRDFHALLESARFELAAPLIAGWLP